MLVFPEEDVISWLCGRKFSPNEVATIVQTSKEFLKSNKSAITQTQRNIQINDHGWNDSIKIRIGDVSGIGKGVFASANIRKGTILAVYRGDLRPWSETDETDKNAYTFAIPFAPDKSDTVWVVDAKPQTDSVALPAHINHSFADSERMNSKFTFTTHNTHQGPVVVPIVVAYDKISRGDEIRVEYAGDVPFTVVSDEATHRGRRKLRSVGAAELAEKHARHEEIPHLKSDVTPQDVNWENQTEQREPGEATVKRKEVNTLAWESFSSAFVDNRGAILVRRRNDLAFKHHVGKNLSRVPGLLVIDPFTSFQIVVTHTHGPRPLVRAAIKPKETDEGYVAEYGPALSMLDTSTSAAKISSLWQAAMNVESLTGPGPLLEFLSTVGRVVTTEHSSQSIYIMTPNDMFVKSLNFLRAFPFMSHSNDSREGTRFAWLFTIYTDVSAVAKSSANPSVFLQSYSSLQLDNVCENGTPSEGKVFDTSTAFRKLALKGPCSIILFDTNTCLPDVSFVSRNSPLLFSVLLHTLRQLPTPIWSLGHTPTAQTCCINGPSYHVTEETEVDHATFTPIRLGVRPSMKGSPSSPIIVKDIPDRYTGKTFEKDSARDNMCLIHACYAHLFRRNMSAQEKKKFSSSIAEFAEELEGNPDMWLSCDHHIEMFTSVRKHIMLRDVHATMIFPILCRIFNCTSAAPCEYYQESNPDIRLFYFPKEDVRSIWVEGAVKDVSADDATGIIRHQGIHFTYQALP